MSDSVRPHRRQPTRLHRPWDSPGKNTGVGCHFLLECMKVESESEVAQLCPTLCDPMDCSLPGSSVHGIFQARVLEWVAIAFSCYAEETNTMFVKKIYSNKKLEFISDFNKVGLRCSSAGKESTCSAGDLDSILRLGRSPGEGKGWLLQFLAWRIPGTIQSMGSQRVRYDQVTFT